MSERWGASRMIHAGNTVDSMPPAESSQGGVLGTREGYDRWSAIYDSDGNPLVALEEPEVSRWIGEPRGLKIADIGCGTGRHTLRLAAAGADLTAVDFSEGMLARARAKP